jgi:hypothetical protein
MKDWPDPRFPEVRVSRTEIAVATVLAVAPIVVLVIGLIGW